jgi:hypothetical protein
VKGTAAPSSTLVLTLTDADGSNPVTSADITGGKPFRFREDHR